MSTLGRRGANGRPLKATVSTNVPPGPVGNLAAGVASSTTIPIIYTAASGTGPISYAAYTSPHGASTWTPNSASLSGTGGTLTGLTSGTVFDIEIVSSNAYGSTAATLLTGISTSVAAASAFSLALNHMSGAAGVAVVLTVTPAGSWPSGEIVVPAATGLVGSFDNGSLTGTGTTPLTFTFIPSSAPGSTGTLTASAAGMVNSSGAQSYTINSVAPSSTATRYDLIASQSMAVAGSNVPVSIYFNGGVPASGTITLAGNGTFSPSSTITLSGQSGPITGITYIPASTAVEHSISGTNTAGLHDPYPAPLTVASSSAGVVSTIIVGSNFFDQRTFQKDTWSGAPTGFAATNGASFTAGWGEVWVQLTSNVASGALYGRLTDADSSGATATGGGTVISNIVQIYGGVTPSLMTCRVLMPASDICYYLDIATDAAFTHPTRVTQRFFVRDVLAIDSRSMECMWLGCYPYNSPPGNTAYCAYIKTTGIGGQNAGGNVDASANAWVRCDGVQSYGAYGMTFGSVGAQEAGRMWHQRKGHGVGIAALAIAGGNMDDHLNADGSPKGGFQSVVAQTGNKFRYFHCLENGWTGTYAPESYTAYQTVMKAHIGWLKANFPALAVIAYGTASGQFGTNGSAFDGYTRLGKIITSQVEPTDPMVISTDAGADWDFWYTNSGHAAWESQVRFVRAGSRAMFMADHVAAGGYGYGGANRFLTFAAAGTLAHGSGVIKVPFTLPSGAGNLVSLKWANGISSSSWTYTTPSAAELANLVAVYAGAGGTADSGAALVNVIGVTIDNAAHTLNIAVDLSAFSTPPTQFAVHILCDFNRYAGAATGGTANPTGISLFDDRVIDDCGYGVGVRSAIDIAISTV